MTTERLLLKCISYDDAAFFYDVLPAYAEKPGFVRSDDSYYEEFHGEKYFNIVYEILL